MHGSAGFSQAGNTLTITNSPNAIIHWGGFSIGRDELVRFVQQGSASNVLNRVAGADPSVILGRMLSNGGVFLLNPNGVLIGAGARIDVPRLVVSSLRLSDTDFLAGWLRLAGDGGEGAVTNAGEITTASGGQVLLIAPKVENSGIITSPGGEIILAAGHAVELADSTNPALRVAISATEGEAVNLGRLIAEGGRAGMYAGLVRQAGAMDAGSAVAEGGRVFLKARVLHAEGDTGADGARGGGAVGVEADRIAQTGALHADSAQGQGGTVTVAAQRISQTEGARVSADGATAGGNIQVAAGAGADGRLVSSAQYSATGAHGGDIRLDGEEIALLAARLDANGDAGGGAIRVGGGAHDARQSARTYVNFSSRLNADARADGQGGSVAVWSKQRTEFFGHASARGGAAGGDGGRIDLSGAQSFLYGGTADAGAPRGLAGTFKLDPKNLIIDATGSGGYATVNLVDPHAGAGDGFGKHTLTLSDGNIAATDPLDDFEATDAGAVYLFNGSTGGLMATVTGTHADDQVGSGGLYDLGHGRFLIHSPQWDNGAIQDAGALTWAGASLNEAVSGLNSLVGRGAFNRLGSGGITVLANGNYVVASPNWDAGAVKDAGAVTWGSGATGVKGEVSESNSLTGGRDYDRVGSGGITALTNGSYVVGSGYWDHGTAVDAGAVTWGDGDTGLIGTVSESNSLVGSSAYDHVGSFGITALANGNYVVSSAFWDRGAIQDAGAVSFGDGNRGVAGIVSEANSLVGSARNDAVGSGGVYALTNGNYVVASPGWSHAGVTAAGAATWGDGARGTTGEVSADNSLTGSSAYDHVGGGGVTALANGNYVVASPEWDQGGLADLGAATWGNGSRGVAGAVTEANSLTGGTAGDQVGSGGATALTNGNYVVASPDWDQGALADLGAATWGNGSRGSTGTVAETNSLTGGNTGDGVAEGGVVALDDGDYAVVSPHWDRGSVADAGAVTTGNGAWGMSGPISAANSIVGNAANDQVGSGGVSALANGGYVVASPEWDNDAVTDAGAVTWVEGRPGIPRTVAAANSLVGTSPGDRVGSGGVTPLADGHYAVASPDWDRGALEDAGAVTWGDGVMGASTDDAVGAIGAVSAANSLTGGASDRVGAGSVRGLADGRVLVGSPAADAGAGRLQIYVPAGAGGSLAFGDAPAEDATLSPARITAITNTGTAVVLQANNDIRVDAPIQTSNAAGAGGSLTLQAGRSIEVNAGIHTAGGDLTLIANESVAAGVVDAQRAPGAAVIRVNEGVVLEAGVGRVELALRAGTDKTHNDSDAIELVDGARIQAGAIALSAPAGDIRAGNGSNDALLDTSAHNGAITLAARSVEANLSPGAGTVRATVETSASLRQVAGDLRLARYVLDGAANAAFRLVATNGDLMIDRDIDLPGRHLNLGADGYVRFTGPSVAVDSALELPDGAQIDAGTSVSVGDGQIEGAGSLTNRGVFTAGARTIGLHLINDGQATLDGSTIAGFTNTGELDIEGMVRVSADATLAGGSLELAPEAVLDLGGGLDWSGGTLGGTGTFNLPDGGQPRLVGAGDRLLANPNVHLAYTDLTLPLGSLTIADGSLSLAASADGGTWLLEGSTLTLAGGSLDLEGTMYVGGSFNLQGGRYAGGGSLINLGTGRVNRPRDADVAWDNSGGMENAGTVSLANFTYDNPFTNTDGGVVDLGEGVVFKQTFTNEGEVRLTGPAEFEDGYRQAGGTTTLAGGELIGDVTLSGGTLGGIGTIRGGFTVEGDATLAPGASPGAMRITGDMWLKPGANLLVELGGTVPGSLYDQIQVDGRLTLGGSLKVATWNGYAPAADAAFSPLLATGGVTGSFDSVELPGADYRLAYRPNAVEVQYLLPGEEPAEEPVVASEEVSKSLEAVDAGTTDNAEPATDTAQAATQTATAGTDTGTTGTTDTGKLAETKAVFDQLAEQAKTQDWSDGSRLVCR